MVSSCEECCSVIALYIYNVAIKIIVIIKKYWQREERNKIHGLKEELKILK